MSYITIPASSAASSNEYRAKTGQFAQSLFSQLTDWHYFPIDSDTQTSALALTGSATAIFVAGGSGLLQASTGATAGSRVFIINKQDAGNSFCVTRATSDFPWYIQARIMVPTALDNQAIVGLRLSNTGLTTSVFLGFRGPSSTAFLTLEGVSVSTVRVVTDIAWPANIATTVLDLGIACDGSRIIPCAGNVLLGTMQAYPSSSDIITDPNAIPITVQLMGVDAQNGATAAARTVQMHKFFFARSQQP